MLFVRVDDYPSGSDMCHVPGDARGLLARFMEAFPFPFGLGIVFGFLSDAERAEVIRLPNVFPIAHGLTHNLHECEEDSNVGEMARLLGTVKPRIVIPPKNLVGKVDILARHFDWILTGPNGPRKQHAKLVWPSFYGLARDLVQCESGVISLHLAWEARDGFKGMRRLAENCGDRIRPWTEFTR